MKISTLKTFLFPHYKYEMGTSLLRYPSLLIDISTPYSRIRGVHICFYKPCERFFI